SERRGYGSERRGQERRGEEGRVEEGRGREARGEASVADRLRRSRRPRRPRAGAGRQLRGPLRERGASLLREARRRVLRPPEPDSARAAGLLAEGAQGRDSRGERRGLRALRRREEDPRPPRRRARALRRRVQGEGLEEGRLDRRALRRRGAEG